MIEKQPAIWMYLKETMKNHKTYVLLLLDSSLSMKNLRTDVVKTFNQRIGTIRQEAEKYGQETQVCLIQFDSIRRTQFYNKPTNRLQPISYDSYNPTGPSTALLDALGLSITELQQLYDANDPNTSFLVMIITDGEENSSYRYNRYTLNKLMQNVQATDRWTLTFEVPVGHKRNLCSLYGIPEDNVREWETTSVGLEQTTVHTQSALSGYFKDRSKGITSTRNFYVQTDLSNLKTKELKQKLDDVSSEFRVLNVDKECEIRDFVESKGLPYKKGCAFYELTKPETVQGYKEVSVMEKTGGRIYGGSAARNLIGLPSLGKAKVTPLDHGKFTIFINSTSVNRKLVRGTKLLVKKNV